MDALLTEEDKASRVRLLSRSKNIQNAKTYRKKATTSLKAKLKSAQKSVESANRRVSAAMRIAETPSTPEMALKGLMALKREAFQRSHLPKSPW